MIVGIDLGTTNSLISVWRDGEIVLIPNALDEVLTPSAVSINDDDHVLVGRAARDVWLTRPEHGAVAFKRHMGSQRPYRLGKQGFSVKEMRCEATATLTGKGHVRDEAGNQALAGAMKPNLVRALIQRGALR